MVLIERPQQGSNSEGLITGSPMGAGLTGPGSGLDSGATAALTIATGGDSTSGTGHTASDGHTRDTGHV